MGENKLKIDYETHGQFLIDFWVRLLLCASIVIGGIVLTLMLDLI